MSKYLLPFIMTAIFVRCICYGVTDDYGMSGRYLNYGVGARALSMGTAYTGLADDVSSIYWNPSAISLVPHGASLFYQQLFVDTNYNFVGYVLPSTYLGTAGIGIVSLNSSSIDETAETGESSGSLNSMETALLCSYGYQFSDCLLLGASAKLVRQKIGNYVGVSYGVDVGSMYFILDKKVIFGADIKNVLAPVILLDQAEDVFPLNMRFGVAIKLFNDNLILTTDAMKQEYQSIKLYSGIEVNILKKLFLRMGLYDTNQFTTGFGVKFGVLGIDYAFSNQNVNNSHKFSINYSFDNFVAKIKYKIFTGQEKFLRISIKTNESIRKWDLTIRSQRGNIVQTVGGSSQPSDEVVVGIEGVSDKYYNCELVLVSNLNHTKTISKRVKLR